MRPAVWAMDYGKAKQLFEALERERVQYLEAFTFDDLEISRIPFEGLTISVASPRTLYRMKKDTVRLKDRADAALLRERFGIEDERCPFESFARSRR